MSSRIDITGRVVAITGAARGIGYATATALRARGARIAIGDIDAEAATRAAQSLGDDVLATRLDVTDPASYADFLALIEREVGAVDVLINNAGIMPIGPFLDESASIAQRVMDINVLGMMTGMKLALPAMLARGHGHIVNVASIAGKSPVPGGASYAASKAAIISLTESARVEFAGKGIEFTCVMPSFTATELIAGTKGTRLIPNVQPEDVAAAIAAAVERPCPDVYVPAVVGVIARTQPFLGRRLRDTINHLIGADRTFLDIDHGARAGYDSRITSPSEADPAAPSPSDTEPAAKP
jgi:NAD(P)-dependent dehydrogenase (short-subunit alcohol dehydrogenase family)